MAATELEAGTAFGTDGRYRIQRLLSTGGMASVWLARDTLLHRDVAVKFLSDALALDRDYVVRFAREARVAAGLTHPHLVRIYDYSGEDRRPFLVMEFISGGSLSARLADPAATVDPLQVLEDVLGALAYIHDAGVVHRDIKPANLLVGPDGRVRLTDFGIAQPSAETQITKTGLVLGTARYLAPEVLGGERASARSDLYSCGVLLEQMLGDAPAPALRALAAHLTAPNPSDRPQTAGHALAELRAVQATAPARAPETAPATAPTRVAPPAAPRPTVSRERRAARVWRTRPATVAAAGVMVVLLIIGIVASSGGGGTPSPPPAPPARSAPLSSQLGYLDQTIDAAHR